MSEVETWNREALFDHLKELYPTFSVGQHYKHDINPYVVLKAMSQGVGSSGSTLGGWQYYNILCYVPDTSISQLDGMLKSIRQSFIGSSVEVTGSYGEDFHETEIDMYMRFIEVRIPKEV